MTLTACLHESELEHEGASYTVSQLQVLEKQVICRCLDGCCCVGSLQWIGCQGREGIDDKRRGEPWYQAATLHFAKQQDMPNQYQKCKGIINPKGQLQ